MVDCLLSKILIIYLAKRLLNSVLHFQVESNHLLMDFKIKVMVAGAFSQHQDLLQDLTFNRRTTWMMRKETELPRSKLKKKKERESFMKDNVRRMMRRNRGNSNQKMN